MEIKEILKAVKDGELSVDEAVLKLKIKPFHDIGYAKVDIHRELRQGRPEVIYGAGKTVEQITGIIETMQENGQDNVLVTRIGKAEGEAIKAHFEDVRCHPEAGIAIKGRNKEVSGIGTVLVATGGTSDIPVAEEAALTAEFFGNKVTRLYDVGVAGLHRLLSHAEEIMDASVIIAVAGMEGALASVIGGLTDCPVIAVPTSVG